MVMRCAGEASTRPPNPIDAGETRITGSGSACTFTWIGTLREPPGALVMTTSAPVKSPEQRGLCSTLHLARIAGQQVERAGVRDRERRRRSDRFRW
jgi:hypothetical protein